MKPTVSHLIYAIPAMLVFGLFIIGMAALFKPDLLHDLWFVFVNNGGINVLKEEVNRYQNTEQYKMCCNKSQRTANKTRKGRLYNSFWQCGNFYISDVHIAGD